MRDAARANDKAPRVLLATNVGIHAASSIFDSYLAVALTAHGASCDVALCDGALPACLAAEYTWYPNVERFAARGSRDDLCTACLAPAEKLFGANGLGLTVHRYAALLTEADRARARDIAEITPLDEIGDLVLDDINVGEAALSGALRFFARGALDGTPAENAILKRYLEAACLAQFAMRRLITQDNYDVVIGHHGIYVPQALVAEAARVAGVRFVAWNPAYRAGCFIFNHDETYHRGMISEPSSVWETLRSRRGGADAAHALSLRPRERARKTGSRSIRKTRKAPIISPRPSGSIPRSRSSRCSPRWCGMHSCITGSARSRIRSNGC